MTHIVVTGGAGFIGSHLVDRLVCDGHRVTVVDDLSTGSRDNVRDAELVVQDVRDPIDVGPVDGVYHLACPASPRHYQSDPVRTLLTAVLGTRNALDIAREHDCPVVVASTSEVYGEPRTHPQIEDDLGWVDPTGVRACYVEGKRASESLAFDYHRSFGVPVRVARIFNTYGPRMCAGDGRVVSTFIAQALSGEPLTLFGDGSQTRSFCFVDDTVDGLVQLFDQSVPGPFNLGNPAELSVVALVDVLEDLLGSPLERVYRPLPSGDPTRRCPSIERARTAFGFVPKVTLVEGLQRTIGWFREVGWGP